MMLQSHQEVIQLEAAIGAEPYNLAHFNKLLISLSGLIDTAETNDGDGNAESIDAFKSKIESYRNMFLARFHPDLQFWQSWIFDCIREKSHLEVLRHYEDLVLVMYPHHELATDYVDYCAKLLEAEEIVS